LPSGFQKRAMPTYGFPAIVQSSARI